MNNGDQSHLSSLACNRSGTAECSSSGDPMQETTQDENDSEGQSERTTLENNGKTTDGDRGTESLNIETKTSKENAETELTGGGVNGTEMATTTERGQLGGQPSGKEGGNPDEESKPNLAGEGLNSTDRACSSTVEGGTKLTSQPDLSQHSENESHDGDRSGQTTGVSPAGHAPEDITKQGNGKMDSPECQGNRDPSLPDGQIVPDQTVNDMNQLNRAGTNERADVDAIITENDSSLQSNVQQKNNGVEMDVDRQLSISRSNTGNIAEQLQNHDNDDTGTGLKEEIELLKSDMKRLMDDKIELRQQLVEAEEKLRTLAGENDLPAVETRLPFGLINDGNRCYLNAVLQNLSQTLLLQYSLEGLRARISTKEPAAVEVNKATIDFFDQTVQYFKKSEAFWPAQQHIAISNRSTRFEADNQQDSHELLRHLMDGLKEEEKQLEPSNKGSSAMADTSNQKHLLTVVDKVFGGHFLTIYHCLKCDQPFHLFEPFLDISLPVHYGENLDTSTAAKVDKGIAILRQKMSSVIHHGKDARHEAYKESIEKTKNRIGKIPRNSGTPQKQKHLLDSLTFYTRQEYLSEHLCIHCNKDKGDNYTLTPGTKQTIIYNPPAVLTIHFKRFRPQRVSTFVANHAPRFVRDYVTTDSHYTKVDDYIKFDTTLDLAPFCSAFSQRQRTLKTVLYSLYGVIVHIGQLSAGHYSACIRVRKFDASYTRAFLQKKFFDRELLMGIDQFIELVREVPRCIENDRDLTAGQLYGDAQWYDVSDESVREIDEDDVKEKQAYLLFYERVY